MQLVKFTHACVRLVDGDRNLLIDPGVWVEQAAFDGATDILITHEHIDHVDEERLVAAARADSGLQIFAPDPIADKLRQEVGPAVTTVAPGDSLTAAGFAVQVVGGAHAEIYEGLPGCANVGYLVSSPGAAGWVYHPGDSFFVPEAEVDTLLVPISAPWLKLAEGLDFVRAVAPKRAFPIHDRSLSEDIGQPFTDRWFEMKGETSYARIPTGGTVDL
jgi:L-ascorbate metabolism protein UlaG (beta-lactamase superfamily)